MPGRRPEARAKRKRVKVQSERLVQNQGGWEQDQRNPMALARGSRPAVGQQALETTGPVAE